MAQTNEDVISELQAKLEECEEALRLKTAGIAEIKKELTRIAAQLREAHAREQRRAKRSLILAQKGKKSATASAKWNF